MISISKNCDPNYLATVIECPELKQHPNADRLEIANVFGGDVIVAKGQYQKGELLCYFPVESCISQKFLAWANLLDKAESNADGKTKGFFSSKNGRVRAIKLREIPSQGFLFKVSKLAEYYGVKESVFKLGESFDTINDDLLVKKYVSGERKSGNQNESKKRIPKWIENTVRIFPLPIRKRLYTGINYFYDKNKQGIGSLIVDGHWHFHGSTEQLGKNIFKVDPYDDVVCTSKYHGTSAVYGNILCKKPFNIFRYIGNKIGLDIEDTEHKLVYSSRTILKNRRDGKFTDDVWGVIASRLDGKILKNYTIYGEIVGYTSSSKMVQKNYDYGVKQGEVEFFVYRMTKNTPDGIHECSWNEIESFCMIEGLKHVPVYYKGKAKDMFNIFYNSDFDPSIWREKFLTDLKDKYLDKTCEFCTTGVVNEGIVIRNESDPKKTALKYKSPMFLLGESADRDKGETNMEEEN
jgi:hypothetical protein